MDGEPEKKLADKDNSEYKCQFCLDASFPSKTDFIRHLQSDEHIKKSIIMNSLKKTNERSDVKGISNTTPEDRSDVSNSNLLASLSKDSTSDSLTSPAYIASGQDPKSTKEKQTEKINKILEHLSENTPPSYPETVVLNCQVCSMEFSGPMPYVQHMKSLGHEKKLKKKQLTESLKSLEDGVHELILIDDNGGQYCKRCRKMFTGVESAYQHLTGKKHYKVKDRQELLEEISKRFGDLKTAISEDKDVSDIHSDRDEKSDS